jgi:alkanesulfonate monooxygenase
VVKPTRAEAEDTVAELSALVHDDVLRQAVAMDLEVDLSHLSLDERVPAGILPEKGNLHTQYFDALADAIRRRNPTLRELGRMNHRGNSTLVGDPGEIADLLEERFAAGSADGFMFRFPLQPDGLDDFVDLVVPELQRRGLFRTAYSADSLRGTLGLPAGAASGTRI